MEHIRQYDWCATEPDVYFLNETDIDNCVTERILRNKFHNPLISSESEDDEQPKIKINWQEILSKKKFEKTHRLVVPGLHSLPPFPKLSALTSQQHYQCLKVLCADHPQILPTEFVPRPTKQDRKIFEELKEVYAKEQQEFKEWAKTMWTSNHCVRALRPKPPIEMVYEAEFKMAAHEMQSFPKNYAVAAQIPLETPNASCELVHEKDLISVTMSTLPKISVPDMSEKVFIMQPYPVPEPCSKHPCRFQLPGETDMTILPLTEVHKELAQYAADNGAQYIASEEALRCLMQLDGHWLLPLSVCRVIGPEGSGQAVVLGWPVSRRRDTARVRTRKAFQRLLEHTLAPPVNLTEKRGRTDSFSSPNKRLSSSREPDSSDDEGHLFIDTDSSKNNAVGTEEMEEEMALTDLKRLNNAKEGNTPKKRKTSAGHETKIDFYNCTCKDTFDKPPQRSYKKWKVVNWTTNDKYSIVVHCPHRVRSQSGEVVLEPIPEYQLDLGASEQSPHTHRAQALALTLRKNASILNVRVDSASGEVVTCEPATLESLLARDTGLASDVTNRLYTALEQLQGLLPGRYLLQHEPSHGDNAILYASRADADADAEAGAGALSLGFSCAERGEPHEAAAARAPPALAPVLLPAHKYRKILPLALTPFPTQLAKEPKKPVARQKTPPQALKLGEAPGDTRTRGKWPKKKNRKRKKKNNNNTSS